ncbi:MAG: capsule biosynthesis protein [Pseudomonas sp.]|nr:capsule biosynthesis protein [Pseudomonas sp.]
MINPDGLDWLLKSRELDRYRWLLLRERHGLLGSSLRFVREAIIDLLFGLRARSRLARAIAIEQCDILLLQSAPKVIKLQRKKLLIDGLSKRHALIESALQEPRTILAQRLLKPPVQKVPLRYFGYAAYAEWLVERYQPRILLNDRNGSLYSPFLRLALNARDRLLVHLAHATTVEHSQRLSMNDYDYYFLFGQSSLDALQARALRFGNSKAVLLGSHMVDQTFSVPTPRSGRVMLVLGVGPDKEKEPGYQRTYALIRDWVAENESYSVLFKAHPRSKAIFWHEAAKTLKNVSVLPVTCGLADALAQTNLVISIMSNAVVEAALAQRPIIYVNLSDDVDMLNQSHYFGGEVDSGIRLSQAVDRLSGGLAAALEASERFSEYHLANGVRGLDRNIECLQSLLCGDVVEFKILSGTV